MLGRLALALVVVLAAVVIVSLWWWSGSAEEIVPDVAPEGREMEEVMLSEGESDSPPDRLAIRESVEATDAAPEGASMPPLTIVVTGRVVDESRVPVSDVLVELVLPISGTFFTRTDEAGRFRLAEVEPSPEGAGMGFVRATDGSGLVGVMGCRGLDARPGDEVERDVGVVVLSRANAVPVSVVRAGAPLPGARVVALASRTFAGELAEATTDEQGRAVLENLPDGWLLFEATAPGQQGEIAAMLPDWEEREFVIELQDLRTVEIRVVDAESKVGIEGAQVEAWKRLRVPAHDNRLMPYHSMENEHGANIPAGLSPPPTDAQGWTRLEAVPEGGRYQLGATAPGHLSMGTWRRPSVNLNEGETRATIELQYEGRRTVRWPLVGGEVSPPAEGAVIVLHKRVDRFRDNPDEGMPTRGVVQGGAVVVEEVPRRSFRFVATAPDDSVAWLWVSEEKDVGPEVSFRRPRRIEVRVFGSSGAPVAGASVRPYDQGNNPVADPAATDDDGLAVLDGLVGGLVEVRVNEPNA